MRKGALVATLSLALLLVAPPSNAQHSGKVWRIGLFQVGLDHVPPSLDGLREGLKALGYEEGRVGQVGEDLTQDRRVFDRGDEAELTPSSYGEGAAASCPRPSQAGPASRPPAGAPAAAAARPRRS